MLSPSFFQRLTCAALLMAVLPVAQAANGIVTDASGTYEEVRFYTPGTADIPTQTGTVLYSSDLCSGTNVCASGLQFTSQYAGTFAAYGFDAAAANSLTSQSLITARQGLGVLGQSSTGTLGTDTAVDAQEYLTFAFSSKATVIGFQLFDVNGQALASTQAVHVIVDEMDYTLPGGSLTQALTGKSFTFVGSDASYYVGAVRLATAVPENSTATLMGLGLVGLGAAARRRRTPH